MAENARRNFAEGATGYTAEQIEKTKTTVQEATKMVEHSYVTASKGAVDFNRKLIDMAQESMNAAFDFARQVPEVRSPSQFLEFSASHARKQFENLSKQTQHLTGLAQKAIMETAESWQNGAKSLNQSSTSSNR